METKIYKSTKRLHQMEVLASERIHDLIIEAYMLGVSDGAFVFRPQKKMTEEELIAKYGCVPLTEEDL